MQQGLSDITYVLDRSGSMERLTDDAIGGFNSFLNGQQNQPGEALFTLALFDHEYLLPYQAQPIRDAPGLNRGTYQPRGSTALLDAIGRTIDETGQRLAALPEAERPETVIIAVFTDGLENASKHYQAQRIAKMIEHQQTVYQWEFIFLAANQDAIQTAASFNIPKANAINVAATGEGMYRSNEMLDQAVTQRRQRHR